MLTYKIWCEVSGGLLGPGATWLKRSGVEFETRDENEAKATALELNNRKRNSPATFKYTVEEFYSGDEC